MVLIHGTNIVIDEFNYGKKTPWIRYIYILTHFHGGMSLRNLVLNTLNPIVILLDHYSGLEPGFNFGKVYCSEITKRLALGKFPGIVDIVVIPLYFVIMGVMHTYRKVCL